MAIRLRYVDARCVALCAARSVEKDGDVYLDDAQHYALSEKFWDDYPALGIGPDPETARLRDQEESNNANRTQWDATFGKEHENSE